MGISLFIIYYNIVLPNSLKGFLFFIQVEIEQLALCLLNVLLHDSYIYCNCMCYNICIYCDLRGIINPLYDNFMYIAS